MPTRFIQISLVSLTYQIQQLKCLITFLANMAFSLKHESKINTDKAQGLTLYPHFSSVPKAGWFDENSPRKVFAKSYENTVLLVPSTQFINSLPYQKLPD